MMENALSIGLLMLNNTITDGPEKAMLARWRREYEAYTDRNRKSKQVLAAIAEGYDTISEIAFVTRLNVTTLRRVTNRLIEKKKIRQRRIKNLNSKTELKFELV
jgi:hypothetical protein